MNVIYYTTTSGREPVRDYIEGLPVRDQILIAADIRLIVDFGIFNAPVNTRKIKGKLWEIKTGLGNHQRIFYCVINKQDLILLHACKKQKEGSQQPDIELAISRAKEVL